MILNQTLSRLFLLFLVFFVGVFFLLSFSPFEAVSGSVLHLACFNFIFILLFYFPALILSSITGADNAREEISSRQVSIINSNVNFCIVFSWVGMLLIVYDRVFVRGIDYSVGLRAARYQWLDTTGGGFYSVLGNLLSPLAYVGVFLLICHYRKLRKSFIFVILSLAPVYIHAALNGGRSNVLLAMLLVLIAFLMSEGRLGLFSLKKILGFLFFSFSFSFYVSYITSSSASLGDVSLNYLLHAGAVELNGKLKDSQVILEYGNVEALFHYVSVYLIHGQWGAQIILNDSIREGAYFLYPFSVILSKLGIISAPLEAGRFSETGAFLSLPASILYDFGVFGFVTCSFVLGVLFGFLLRSLHARHKIGGIKLAFLLYFIFLAVLAPVVPAFGFSYLNFILYAFLLVGTINYILFGRGARFL